MLGHDTQPDNVAETRNPKETRMNLRTTTRQDALIRRAANTLDKSVTEFVLESVTIAAEQVLADRRWFQLDDNDWDAFQVALERPPVLKPRLRSLLAASTTSSLDAQP